MLRPLIARSVSASFSVRTHSHEVGGEFLEDHGRAVRRIGDWDDAMCHRPRKARARSFPDAREEQNWRPAIPRLRILRREDGGFLGVETVDLGAELFLATARPDDGQAPPPAVRSPIAPLRKRAWSNSLSGSRWPTHKNGLLAPNIEVGGWCADRIWD